MKPLLYVLATVFLIVGIIVIYHAFIINEHLLHIVFDIFRGLIGVGIAYVFIRAAKE